MNHSQATICVLTSEREEQDSFRKCLYSLEESGYNIDFFSDPNECVESLISAKNQNYLLVLGSGHCHLVDILSALPCSPYIYLTELHDFKDASHVQGIYSEPKTLLEKLKKDAKMIEDSLSFSISSCTEAAMSGTSTRDIQDDKMAFVWIRVILSSILHTPKPTEYVYGDMLEECRDIYQKKQSVCQQIDDFEKKYNSKDAILWYTKDSFFYRQLNAAFRTENILIIWKFRFIIQDIYNQLKLLHEEQNKDSNSKCRKPWVTFAMCLLVRLPLCTSLVLLHAKNGVITYICQNHHFRIRGGILERIIPIEF